MDLFWTKRQLLEPDQPHTDNGIFWEGVYPNQAMTIEIIGRVFAQPHNNNGIYWEGVCLTTYETILLGGCVPNQLMIMEGVCPPTNDNGILWEGVCPTN